MRLGLVILIVTLAVSRGDAAPMYTKLTTIRGSGAAVVIGVVHHDAHGMSIDVDRVIRGPATIGTMSLKDSPDGHVNGVSGKRVVAVVDAGALRWVGELIAGPAIESGVLRLRGFFDFNAHVVSPGVMSLAELENFLQTGTLDQVFAVTLAFPDSHGVLQPSTKTFTIKLNALTGTTSATGLTFACLDQLAVFPPDHGTLEVSLIGACPASATAKTRQMTLEGMFTGWNAKTRALEATLAPMRPFLDEKGFEKFVGDASWADVTSVVSVKLGDGSKWTWNIESDLVDPHGVHHKAGGMSSTSEDKAGVTVTKDIYDFSGPKIVISPAPDVGSPGGNARGILPMVDAGTAGCKLRRGGVEVPCTLKHEPSVFVRR